MTPHGLVYQACRCGGKHDVRERSVPCRICAAPTFDHHAICPRGACRRGEESTNNQRGTGPLGLDNAPHPQQLVDAEASP